MFVTLWSALRCSHFLPNVMPNSEMVNQVHNILQHKTHPLKVKQFQALPQSDEGRNSLQVTQWGIHLRLTFLRAHFQNSSPTDLTMTQLSEHLIGLLHWENFKLRRLQLKVKEHSHDITTHHRCNSRVREWTYFSLSKNFHQILKLFLGSFADSEHSLIASCQRVQTKRHFILAVPTNNQHPLLEPDKSFVILAQQDAWHTLNHYLTEHFEGSFDGSCRADEIDDHMNSSFTHILRSLPNILLINWSK